MFFLKVERASVYDGMRFYAGEAWINKYLENSFIRFYEYNANKHCRSTFQLISTANDKITQLEPKRLLN